MKEKKIGNKFAFFNLYTLSKKTYICLFSTKVVD